MVESEAKFETNIENYSKVAGKGIRVNSVNPGVIVTGIFETAGMTPMQVTEYYEARMMVMNTCFVCLHTVPKPDSTRAFRN